MVNVSERYIKISDLEQVEGIGKKTIQKIKETLLRKESDNENTNYKTTFDLPLNNFYVSDSVQWMKENLPSNFIDLTITSPPYNSLRKYEGFKFDYQEMIKELYRVTKEGGIVVWIVADQTINGSETGTSFRQALFAKDVGFNLHDTMIWRKPNPTPKDPKCLRYYDAFEYMFIFSKGKPKTCNYIKEKTKNSGKKFGSAPMKRADGSARIDRTLKLKDSKVKEYKIKSNVWDFPIGSGVSKDKIAFKHPAIFPEQLVKDHILTWSDEGDIIFDPMCGSGTTCKMAFLNNRKFIGVDVSEKYIKEICIPRLEKYGWKQYAGDKT